MEKIARKELAEELEKSKLTRIKNLLLDIENKEARIAEMTKQIKAIEIAKDFDELNKTYYGMNNEWKSNCC